MRVLGAEGHDVVGLDVLASPYTHLVGSIADRAVVRAAMEGVDAVLHAATLHKPHVGSHDRRAFVDTNVTGTLNLLEEAVAAGASRFVFTSTTSAFGRALTPPPGAPAAWITEDVAPVPRNIYGATKTAAEDLCELVHRDHGLPCLILRTSRFFPEDDDRDDVRSAYRGRQPQGQRAAVPPRRPRGRRERPPLRARARAGARLRPLHHQRHDAVHPRRPRRAARRRARGRAAALPRRRRALRAARLAHVPGHRARLRQRARPRGARLGAALGLPPRARSARGRRGRRAASSPPRSAPRATTPRRPGCIRASSRGRSRRRRGSSPGTSPRPRRAAARRARGPCPRTARPRG